MKRIHIYKRIVSTLLLLCMLLSCVEFTAFAAPLMRDGEVVKQGALVTSEDGMVTVQETAVHTSGNNFNVTMTVTTSDLVEIEPVRPAHIVLCIDRSNSMDGQRRTNTKTAVEEFVSGVLNETGIAAGNQVAVVGFGTRYWNHCGLTNDVSEVNSAVSAATSAVSNVNDGGTNVQAGLYAAQQVLASDNSTAQKIIVLFSDGMPTYSYRLTGTADWTGCSGSGRRHNWNERTGEISNLTTQFDHNTIVGSGSAYEYNQNSHYASLRVTCEHGWSTTMTDSIYTNNGQPAIAQAKTAKDAGIEIYTVFLDGYGYNEQSSKKNAEETMKSVATNEDHYMATQDMSELSSLFQSIGSSLVTPTNAGTVAAPMGSYIQLGEISGLESVGITKTVNGLTWNVTAVTPSVDAETGMRTYSVTYPISLQVEKAGFVEAKPYAVNPSATLTYFVGGAEKKVSFDIPTVRGYLPSVEYSIRYYLQGAAEAGDYANYTLQDTETGLTGKLHSKIGYPSGYETKYPDHAFVYSSTGEEMTLSSIGTNVMCLYYDSTYVPPVDVSYTVRHEYYTNGEKDGAVSMEQTAPEGTALSSAAVEKVCTYNDETYEYTGATPDTITITEGCTIILRYDRTVIIPVSYTVRHEYYTNDVLDGAITSDCTAPEGTEISASDLEKVCTYNDADYEFTSADPSVLTVSAGSTIILRYDRTVEIPPVEVNYTVRHEYYTNGEKDGETVVSSTGAEGTVLTSDSVVRNPVYNEDTYEFTGCTPSELTLQPDGDNTIVLRYDRTVYIPPVQVAYTVRHEYYTNGEKDGVVSVEQTGDAGTVLTADTLSKLPTYGEKAYTFTSCAPTELTLTEGEGNTITLRYDRTEMQVPYTVLHVYYTNGEKDGEVPAQLSAHEGTEISVSCLDKQLSFSGAEYTFTSCNPESITLVPGRQDTITLRYDRTVEIPPVEVGYTVIYEYYTNGEKDGEIPVPQIGEGNMVIVGDDLPRLPTFNNEEYEYEDSEPKELTLTPGVPPVIRVRYGRTVEEPVSVKYTVIHQYYTGDKLDGQTQETLDADIGAIIEAAGITKNTLFEDGTYTFTSANYEILVVSEGGENKIILRYIRPAENGDPAPEPTRYYYNSTPDPSPSPASDVSAPQTGDHSDTWLYIFAGAALSLSLIFIIPALSRSKNSGNYKGSRKKK